jgi:cytochrome c5
MAAAREALAAAKEATAAAKETTAAAKAVATQPIPAPAKEIKPALTPEHAAPPAKETPAPAPAVPEHAAPPAKETPAPATPGHAAPTTQETAPAPNQQQAAAALTLPVGIDLARGRQLYNTACIICHRAGVSGAPKLDDKVAWAPRLAQGFNSLATYALHRYKGMLTMDVADKDIVSAVGYMVSVVQ